MSRGVAQLGRALPWGGRGRGFKSRRSDHITIFIGLESFANTIRGALFFIATMPPATDYRSILRAAAPCQHKPKRNPHGKKGRQPMKRYNTPIAAALPAARSFSPRLGSSRTAAVIPNT